MTDVVAESVSPVLVSGCAEGHFMGVGFFHGVCVVKARGLRVLVIALLV